MAKQVSKAQIVANLVSDPEIANMLRQALGVSNVQAPSKLSIERADAKDGSKGVRMQFGAGKLHRWMYVEELKYLTSLEGLATVKEFLSKQ